MCIYFNNEAICIQHILFQLYPSNEVISYPVYSLYDACQLMLSDTYHLLFILRQLPSGYII